MQHSELHRGPPALPDEDEPDRLACRLEQLAAEIRGGTATEIASRWPTLALDVDTHFLAHARELPATASPIERRRVAQRRVERHAAAHALIDEIGRQVHRQQPRASTFDLLAELLRDHATQGG